MYNGGIFFKQKMKFTQFTASLILFCLIGFNSIPTTFAATEGTKRTFTITGYYSPLPNQNFYITGDYASEIRLNGQGIAGADGTPVYPGMIAAPYTYEFGTKICIPRLGCGMVHDRGGAIVEKGKRALAKHDRIDVWMGYGEEGLLRALAWGVEHIESEVFPKGSSKPVFMNFEVPPQLGDIVDLPNRPIFNENLSLGMNGEKVKSLQRGLNDLGFYEGFLNGKFDTDLKKAVLEFQKQEFIIQKETDTGAGIFGPQTRAKLTEVLYKKSIQIKIKETWDNFHFGEDINMGDKNHEVFKLQQILVEEEFMNVHPTGYFGPVTKKALTQFQIAHGLIRNASSAGSGNVGPKTQALLNELLVQKKEVFKKERDDQLAYQKARNEIARIAKKPLEFSQTIAQN